MTDREKEMIVQLVVSKITRADCLKGMNLTESMIEQYTLGALNKAYEEHDSDAVAYALYFGYGVTCSRRFVNILCKLILQDWHVSHENIALLLQDIKSPDAIDFLLDTISLASKLDYFPDDGAALIRKCCFALGDINNRKSRSILKDLLASDNDLIKRYSAEQMEINR